MRIGMIPENPLEWFLCKINAIPFPAEDTLVAMLQTRAVMTASRLGLFEALADAAYSEEELAERLSCQVAGLGSLLSALVLCGYLEKKGEKYGFSSQARKWLTPNGPESVNWFIEFNYDNWERMGKLEHVIQTGESLDIHRGLSDPRQWQRYLYGLHDLAKLAVKEMLLRCSFAHSPKSLLDIGGGHGGYSAAYCRRFPELKAEIFDLPEAINIGKEIIGKHYADVSNRIAFMPGNIEKDAIGSGYDLVFLMNLIHHFEQGFISELLEKIFRGMQPGGALVIVDQIKNKDGATSYLAALAELLFLVMSNGRTYSLGEIKGWLEKTGFSEIRVKQLKVGPGTSVLTAVKK